MATPQDVGVSGEYVAAGSVLEWIDKAGFACAAGWSGSYCVTAYVGNVHFSRRIRPGEVVEAEARIIHTGRTSMQVLVRLGGGDARASDSLPAMHCLLAFVAVDDAGAPRTVPRWEPSTEYDAVLRRNAMGRLELRRAIASKMSGAKFTDSGTSPRIVFRFLAMPRVANFGGKVHGGTVMRWMNEAAFACASGWSSDLAAATYTGGIHFLQPIRIGDVVEVEARLLHTSTTAMHLSVHVRSKSPTSAEPMTDATQCVTIFEDSPGSRTPVRQLELANDEDRALNALARTLIDMRATLPRVPENL